MWHKKSYHFLCNETNKLKISYASHQYIHCSGVLKLKSVQASSIRRNKFYIHKTLNINPINYISNHLQNKDTDVFLNCTYKKSYSSCCKQGDKSSLKNESTDTIHATNSTNASISSASHLHESTNIESPLIETTKKSCCHASSTKSPQNTQESMTNSLRSNNNDIENSNNFLLQANTFSFWTCSSTWKKATINTFHCLIGCSIGDMATMLVCTTFFPGLSMWIVMPLSMINGIATSILLETSILKFKHSFPWKKAFQVAIKMSLISMIAMELAENLTNLYLWEVHDMNHGSGLQIAMVCGLIMGFVTPLPYNYFMLRKFKKSCH